MKIFVFNCGSSSIKSSLYEWNKKLSVTPSPMWEGTLQWKNRLNDITLSIKIPEQKPYHTKIKARSLHQGLKILLHHLVEGETAIVSSYQDIDVIGHRIVHGGDLFHSSVRIDEKVKKNIQKVASLAPLHNLIELDAIESIEKLVGNIPQVAVFDTAFHHTLPKEAYLYPIPKKWSDRGIRRFGFHGISFQYCTAQIQKWAKQEKKILLCHLGSGASLCAVKNGKSIDTTMGFTPLEGLMMDTRSGSIDPGILLYLLQQKKLSTKQLSHMLYHESGLLGVSGFSSDMKDILKQLQKKNKTAAMTCELYLHKLLQGIASMVASMQGLDILVFTGGIGENAPLIREKVGSRLSYMGVKIDSKKNQKNIKQDHVISSGNSKVKVVVIHTQEAFEIARECYKIAIKRNR